MKYLKEITDWGDQPFDVPNHTYIINDANACVGYIKTGTTEEIIFNKPLTQFSRARRKFVTLKRLGNLQKGTHSLPIMKRREYGTPSTGFRTQ